MKNELPVDELEAIAFKDVGEALRQTRLFYQKSLEEVESDLRIRAVQVEAIEAGNISELPGNVYAIGFVRSYAEYLGLDSDQVVALFKAQYMGDSSAEELSFPLPSLEKRAPSFWLAFLCLFVLSGVLYFYSYQKRVDRSLVEGIQPVPENITEHISQDILDATSVDFLPVESVDRSPIENMAKGGEQLTGVVLKLNGDSWVEIKDNEGRVLVSNILQTGDEYFVPNNPGLSMSLGNAANVQIELNGRILKPLGTEGEARSNIPLNIDYLQTLSFEEDALQVFDGEVERSITLDDE